MDEDQDQPTSKPYCPHCGAPREESVWRNYDPRFREADIYCGRCDGYIRSWDPS